MATLPGWLLLVVIMAVGLALRLNYAASHPLETRDGIGYVQFCQAWFDQGAAALPPYMQTKPLLYQYLVCALMHLGITAGTAALAVNLAAGTLLLLPIYLAGKVLFTDRGAALGLSLLAAVMPPLVEYSAVRLRDGLYLFFAAWTICAWLHAMRNRNPQLWVPICGAAALLAMLCRYEAFELTLFAAVTLPVAGWLRTRSWKKPAAYALGFSGSFLAAALMTYCLPGLPGFVDIYLSMLRMR